MRSSRRAALALILIALASCFPEPYYDDTIGVEGVATEPGELAGTWAVHQQNLYLGYVPVLGYDVESGGDQYFLMQRSWDAEAEQYQESWGLCADYHIEAAGVTIEPTEDTVASVDVQATLPVVDHPAGAYHSDDAVQLWALRDLPDLLGTAVPTPDNYQQAPQRDWIYDADGDGKLACTVLVHGLLEGEEYYVSRKITQFRGVVRGPDRVFGLVEVAAAWSVLDATVALAIHSREIPSDEVTQHPDPKRSWFEQVRLADDASCASVRAADADGRLARLRPF